MSVDNLFRMQIILMGGLIFSFIFRVISLAQTGQILLAFGILDILISLAARRGWKILRRDIAENVPLDKHDTEVSPGTGRPTDRFLVEIVSLGIATAIVGLALMWLTSLSS